MSENIDIRVREDGSRVVSRSLDNVADKAEKAERSVKGMNSALDDVQKKGTSLQGLRDNIQQVDRFSSTMVQRFGTNLTQYRNALMKHFEMISKEARATSASLKSQMEAITSTPIGMDAMNAYYREREEVHNRFIRAAADNISRQQALEADSSAQRLKIVSSDIAAREKLETNYTSWWAKELSRRDTAEQKAIADSVKNLKLQEDAEDQSNQRRLKQATQAIGSKKAAEEDYTSWWLAELKKRESASVASALRSAEQRSGMQAFNAERLDRQLIKGANPQSALYAAEDKGNLNQRTALQTLEVQAMQRQMAMMSLLAPMIQQEIDLQNKADDVVKRQIANKEQLTRGNYNLGEATKKAGSDQSYWNEQSREAHSLARGLSGSLGTLWLTYGSLLPLLTGAALGSAFVQAAKSGSEMAYQLQFVKSLGNESADAIEKLKNQAFELGSKSQFGPKEIASGYRILAQAGLEAADSLKVMPDVLNLATVGELGMEQAGLAVVGTLNAFKLGIEESSRVSNLFAKAAAVSQSSVEDLTQAMKYASTVGTQYKQSVDDTMTALALLAKVNIVGTSAGTAYRNMLKEIYTPTKQAADEWERFGIETTKVVNGQRQVRSFVDIMYDLKKVTDKYDEPSQGKIIGYLFGERGAKEAAEMLSMTADQWKAFQDKIVNSAGFGQKVADELNNTAKGQWKIALNTLESELTQSFNRMEPQFKQLAQSFKTIFESQEFRSAVDTIVQTTLTLMQTFLDLAPIIHQVVKAWLVLKAAQIGAGLASMFAAGATAAQGLAAGMLAASGAMGPVARSVGMLTPLIAALGGPLAVILGLLAAGAAAWALWGRNAETASGKAIKSTEERLRQLKSEQKFGDGELGKAREELETRENRLSHMVAARQSGNNLDEARKAVEVQQQLVTLLEEREQKMKDIAKVAVPKVEVPNLKVWEPPSKQTEGTGPSGRLNKDDQALATLQAKLRVLEQEYAIMVMVGDSQFKLNEGAKEAIKIEERITLLKEKNINVTHPKSLKQYQEQLKSLYEQLDVAKELENQQKEITKHKFSEELRRELDFAKMLPREREIENKLLQKRHQLMSEGILLSKEQEESLKNQLESMRDIERLSNAQGALQNSMSPSATDVMEDEMNQWKAVWDTINHMPGGPMYHQEIENVKMYIEELMNIWNEAVKPLQQVEFKLKALNDAFANGGVTAEYYNQKLAEFNIQTAQLLNKLGYGDGLSFIVGSFEQVMQGFVNLSANTSQILGNTWNTLADGLSNSLARSIVYAEDFGTAIRNVARQAVSELIASLIKLGIQYTINQMLASTSIATSLSENAAAAAATAAMWSPAAAAASLASFGSNSSAAIAGMAATKAASTAMFAFATGGSFTVGGSGGVDSQMISFRASPGEKVTVSTPTQVRKGDELNKGKSAQGSNSATDNGVRIINVIDPNLIQDYLTSGSGERTLLNVIQRNSSAVNASLRS